MNRLKAELILGVHLKRGAFWDAVSNIRTRWGIDAEVRLPPDIAPSPHYLPPGLPNFIEFGDEGYEEWATSVDKWAEELRTLHDRTIPEDCRIGGDASSPMLWERFLSACVVYHPPVPGLVEFRDSLGSYLIGGPDPDKGPRYVMVDPPLVQMRDAEKAERAQEEFYLHALEVLIERYIEPQGLDAEEVLRDVFYNTPGLWEGWNEAARQNPPRYFIDPKPHHTEEDVRNAFRMLAAAHTERPAQGRPRRDPLVAAECAILHDHHGWKYSLIAERLLKPKVHSEDENLAEKYARTGRNILRNIGQN